MIMIMIIDNYIYNDILPFGGSLVSCLLYLSVLVYYNDNRGTYIILPAGILYLYIYQQQVSNHANGYHDSYDRTSWSYFPYIVVKLVDRTIVLCFLLLLQSLHHTVFILLLDAILTMNQN